MILGGQELSEMLQKKLEAIMFGESSAADAAARAQTEAQRDPGPRLPQPPLPRDRSGSWTHGPRRTIRGNRSLVFIAPAALLILATILMPIVLSFWISLHQWSLLTPFTDMEWVGLENYVTVFRDPSFLRALTNTIVFAAAVLAMGYTSPWAWRCSSTKVASSDAASCSHCCSRHTSSPPWRSR